MNTLCLRCMSLTAIYTAECTKHEHMHKNYIFVRQGKSKKTFLRILCYFAEQYVCNLTDIQQITCKVIAGTELIIFGNIYFLIKFKITLFFSTPLVLLCLFVLYCLLSCIIMGLEMSALILCLRVHKLRKTGLFGRLYRNCGA